MNISKDIYLKVYIKKGFPIVSKVGKAFPNFCHEEEFLLLPSCLTAKARAFQAVESKKHQVGF